MPGNPRLNAADPDLIKPGDIVWLDAKHLTPTRGAGGHTWPHNAICLYHYNPKNLASRVIVTGTVFQFVCISSVTKSRPLDVSRQVLLDHTDPNLCLKVPSAACVDFAPSVVVTVQGQRHVLDGVRRLTAPVVCRVPASPTFQAIFALFNKYWSNLANAAPPTPDPHP